MTNLEWLNEIGMITTNRVAPNGKLIGVNLVIALRDDDFKKYSEKGFGWLLEEHKEPIKLTQFEHDVLKAFTKLHIYVDGDGIEDFRTLQELNRDGWFNGIGNLSIKEILDNCEVVE
ncbi:hypothetical protein ACTQX5_10095 [Faecalicoccus sp. LCP19S3_E3]|uniref:hypothetical protein n=1 Tax=unclassified Faecalicoccus TaxID=2643311 RepID=UPI003F8E3DCE